MATPIQRRSCAVALATLACTFAVAALAAVPVHIVKTDLNAGIRAAADTPVQFAVLVPKAVSAASDGTWSTAGDKATWRYAVQVPTAVSMSFHATRSSLPNSAVLVVRGAKTTTSYRSRNLHRGELWSRIQPGDALEFTLNVPVAERSRVALNIVSLQAGYRSLGAGVKDHPYYRELKSQRAAASGNSSCVTNYECKIAPSNTPPGQATVALVVGNLYQCSGSLINDVPGDNTPYMLTARHCESGHLGGGNPGAASSVTVYWNAITTPCGATLGSIYDGPTIQTQTGAETVVEQQDAWLIKLDAAPVAIDAQFAGFDASGGAVQGGYTVHHAEGYDKQFTAWFGQAAAVQESGTLGVTYVSNFLETVNQIGNIGPGASGSGLFDQNNHLVGALTLGRSTNDSSGYESCPVANPPAPNGNNGLADFTSLAAVWNSTADTSSATGNTTLKSVLDPANTGTLVVPSAPAAVVTLSAAQDLASDGVRIGLSWSAPNATACTASGGIAGDGWTGALASSGTQTVTESATGDVVYTLSCTFSGAPSAKASVTVTWVGPLPQLNFGASTTTAWATSPVVLNWSSNVAPCSITGGSVSLSNLAASGTATITESTPGDVYYTLTCGTTNDSGEYPLMVQWIPPNLLLHANGTDRLLGQQFYLHWDTAPNTACSPSGGAPNDGWATTAFPPYSMDQFTPQVNTLGTYTYTLQCTAGSVSRQQSVTVTFENNAPYVTAAISAPSVVFSDSPADYVTLTYNSNVTICTLLRNPGSPQSLTDPQGVVTIAPSQSGTYQFSVQCIGAPNYDVTSTPVSLNVSPPPPPTATVSVLPGNTVAIGEEFTISWSSTNASDCTETGNIPGQGQWGPPFTDQPPTGQVGNVSSSTAGPFTIGVTCASIDPNTTSASATTTLNVVPVNLSFTATPTSVTNGSSFTLTWSTTGVTGCTATGGGANGVPWSGSLATSGSMSQKATKNGTFTYEIDCALNNLQFAAQADVTVSGSGSGGGSGGGGGGAIGLLELALLAGMGRLRRRAWHCPAAKPKMRT